MRYWIPQTWTRRVKVSFKSYFVELSLIQDDPTKYYDFSEKIGEGGCCKVYKAINKESGSTFAMKIATEDEMREICTELLMQVALEHENIVSIDSCYNWDRNVYVLLQSGRDG